MAGGRKIKPNGIADSDARICIVLPRETDRQLRSVAARRNSAIAPILREWIIEKLKEVGDGDGGDYKGP